MLRPGPEFGAEGLTTVTDELERIAMHGIRREILLAQGRALGLPGGQLVANPIPEAAEVPRAELAPVISKATQDAADHGITGKALTPYLLQRIFELTDGKSLEANIALVLNNARLGAEIAREMTTLSAQASR